MAFITNVLILEPRIHYFKKKATQVGKLSRYTVICTIMHGMYLFYTMRMYKNRVKHLSGKDN